MGIDLEQSSGDYQKEGSTSNVNVVNMSDDTGTATVNCPDTENTTGLVPSSGVSDVRQEAYAGDGINLISVKDGEPHDGMEFESKEGAFSFYKEYAKSVGFATIIKASRRSRISGKFIDAKFVCTRYGTKTESVATEIKESLMNASTTSSIATKRKRGRVNCSWSKTDCKACMHVKRRQQDGRWVVRSFIKEHNHEIFPDQAYYFRGHRNLDTGKSVVDALHANRARTKRMHVAMSRLSGGYKKNENQKGNVCNQSGKLALEEGDAQVLLDHLMSMQDENPNFFYAIDLDGEQCLRNVFWVDAKSRLDYGNFSDVVFFDTTYIKNEYKLPFAPFIGVNHHCQFLLLGCALLVDETKSTYTWLMRAWLRAMGGHAPGVILTDQEKTLKEAISEVFPNSRHCFCLWHILSKLPEKLSYVTRHHKDFMTKFNKCIFRSWSNEQFEKRWWKMVERFCLRNDVWFQSLYEDRQRWMPTYMKDIFLGGMSTAQRSDINSFFDKYMQRKTTLKEFLEQHRAMLQEKFEDEAKADFETLHKQPGLKSPSPFGKQMAKLYTHAIFRKFQVEVLGVVACHPRKESEEAETKTFKVQDFEENQDCFVVWNEATSYLFCSCHLFEFNGFLCRHVLIVLQISGVHNIPSRYILKRWTKDAKSRQTFEEQSNVVESRTQRYNDLCQRALKLGDEGSLSQESYNIVFNALEVALRKCEIVNNSMQNVIEPTFPLYNHPRNYQKVSQADAASKVNKRSGISKKSQVQPQPEVITIGMQDSWQQMEQLNLRVPTLDGYFGGQQIVQGMGQLNSIASGRDDYCSNQHGIQGLGQLNSMAPIHAVHYVSQQRMQGMGQLHFRLQNIPSCFDMQDSLQEMDQADVGPSQLHVMASKNLNPKHLSS